MYIYNIQIVSGNISRHRQQEVCTEHSRLKCPPISPTGTANVTIQ